MKNSKDFRLGVKDIKAVDFNKKCMEDFKHKLINKKDKSESLIMIYTNKNV